MNNDIVPQNQPLVAPSEPAYQASAAQPPDLPPQPVTQPSQKSYLTTVLLSYFFGTLGVDRFYLGHIWLGLAKLFTGGGLLIWYYVDLVRIVFGKVSDVPGQALRGYGRSSKTVKIVFTILLLLHLLFVVGSLTLVVTLLSRNHGPLVSDKAASVQTIQTDDGQNGVRLQNINAIKLAVEAYYTGANTYPTLAQMNNSSFRGQNLSSLQSSNYQDPTGVTDQLSAKPAKGVVAYQPTPAKCDGTANIPCTGYIITATTATGKTLSVHQL